MIFDSIDDAQWHLSRFNRALAGSQGSIDQAETRTNRLKELFWRIHHEGPKVIRREMGKRDFDELVREMADLLWRLGTVFETRLLRDTLQRMVED